MPPSRSPDAFRVFLDRPGSPEVPWDQWIREFNVYLAAQRCKDGDRKSTLLRYLGLEGRRILLSLQSPRSPNMFWGDPPQTQRVTFDGTETYEQMVSALTAHYMRERGSKLTRIFLYFVEALMFMQMMISLCVGRCKEALVVAVLIAVLKAFLFIWEVIRCVGPWGSRLLHTVVLWLELE